TLKTIDPKFDLASEAELLVADEQEELLGTPEEIMRKELVRSLPALRTLPEYAEALASQLRPGRLVVRTVRYASTGSDREVVEDWLNRTLVVMAGSAGAVASAAVLIAGSLASDTVVRDAAWILGFSGLTSAAVLLLRTVAQALHGQTAPAD